MKNTEQTSIVEPDLNQAEMFLTLIHGKLGGLIDVRAFSNDPKFPRAKTDLFERYR